MELVTLSGLNVSVNARLSVIKIRAIVMPGGGGHPSIVRP